MIDVLHTVLAWVATPLLALGLVEYAYYPLALSSLFRRRSAPPLGQPLVSVIVPAFNEARVIDACVRSILADSYANKEVILVDDGSTDDTLERMRRFEGRSDVTVITRTNGGKGAALNTGVAAATGEFCCFVDADGVFTGRTIEALLAGFDRADVGAVCGNDEPVNLDRHQTRLLALLTHSTALARRALASVGCLTIVSGNCGAFRRRVVDEVGGFAEGTLGEDLELTWRVRAAGHRVRFQPNAIVYAEVPSTVRGLWRQRVRWQRGLIETARRHRHLVGSTRHGRLGPYLVYNLVMMLVVPLAQIVVVATALALVALGHTPIPSNLTSTLIWFGLAAALIQVLVALVFDRAWRDVRHLYMLPAVIVFTVFTSCATARAIWLEVRRAPRRWDKVSRTGTRSRSVIRGAA